MHFVYFLSQKIPPSLTESNQVRQWSFLLLRCSSHWWPGSLSSYGIQRHMNRRVEENSSINDGYQCLVVWSFAIFSTQEKLWPISVRQEKLISEDQKTRWGQSQFRILVHQHYMTMSTRVIYRTPPPLMEMSPQEVVMGPRVAELVTSPRSCKGSCLTGPCHVTTPRGSYWLETLFWFISAWWFQILVSFFLNSIVALRCSVVFFLSAYSACH